MHDNELPARALTSKPGTGWLQRFLDAQRQFQALHDAATAALTERDNRIRDLEAHLQLAADTLATYRQELNAASIALGHGPIRQPGDDWDSHDVFAVWDAIPALVE